MSAHCLVIDGTWSDEHSRFISVISFPNTRSVRFCWFLAFDQNTEFCLSFHIGQFYVVNFTTRTFPLAIRRIEYTSIIFRNKRHSDGARFILTKRHFVIIQNLIKSPKKIQKDQHGDIDNATYKETLYQCTMYHVYTDLLTEPEWLIWCSDIRLQLR